MLYLLSTSTHESMPHSLFCVWLNLVLVIVTAAANVAILNLIAVLAWFQLDVCSELVLLRPMRDLILNPVLHNDWTNLLSQHQYTTPLAQLPHQHVCDYL